MEALTVRATASLKSRATESLPQFSMGLQCQPTLSLPLLKGKSYALSVHSGTGHVRSLCTVLEANLSQGARCALMTPMAPEVFLQRAGEQLSRQMREAVASGQLTLLTMIGEYKQNLARFGPEKLAMEWGKCGITEDTLLVIDHAEQVFSLQHPDLTLAQINVYRQWIKDARCSTLFVFSGRVADSQSAAGHQCVLNNTSGSVRINCDHVPASIWIDFWDAGSRILPEQRLEWIDTHSAVQGIYTVQHGAAAGNNHAFSRAMEPAPADLDDVFYLGGEPIMAGSRVQHNWRRVHDLIDLLHATREAKAATVLIHISKLTNWLHLAQAVHTMRQRCGARLRIAIIDADNVMRYQTELLLLNLGANTVVHGQAATGARLPLLLQSLRSQRYVSSTTVSFDKAVDSATPPNANGYLPPADFYQEALSALAKSSILSIPCAVVTMPIPPGQPVEAAAGRFRLSRQGDLLTANSTHCFAFLYGCAATDLQSLLPRLLDGHDPHRLSDISIMTDEDAIVAALSMVEDDKWVLDQVMVQVADACASFVDVAAGAN